MAERRPSVEDDDAARLSEEHQLGAPSGISKTGVVHGPAYCRSGDRQSSRRMPGARASSRIGSGVVCASFAARQAMS